MPTMTYSLYKEMDSSIETDAELGKIGLDYYSLKIRDGNYFLIKLEDESNFNQTDKLISNLPLMPTILNKDDMIFAIEYLKKLFYNLNDIKFINIEYDNDFQKEIENLIVNNDISGLFRIIDEDDLIIEKIKFVNSESYDKEITIFTDGLIIISTMNNDFFKIAKNLEPILANG
jgi:hypothetical protein